MVRMKTIIKFESDTHNHFEVDILKRKEPILILTEEYGKYNMTLEIKGLSPYDLYEISEKIKEYLGGLEV